MCRESRHKGDVSNIGRRLFLLEVGNGDRRHRKCMDVYGYGRSVRCEKHIPTLVTIPGSPDRPNLIVDVLLRPREISVGAKSDYCAI